MQRRDYDVVRRHSMIVTRTKAFTTLLILCAVFVFSALTADLAAAQDIFGVIAGTVTDPTGAAVPHAKITITNQDTKLERVVICDDRGYYVAPQLSVGTYQVT